MSSIMGEEFPIIFNSFPDIGASIFANLNFKDIEICRSVCKDWYQYLNIERALWINLLNLEYTNLELEFPLTPACSEEYIAGDLGDPRFTDYELRQLHMYEHADVWPLNDCESCNESRKIDAEKAKESWFWLINAVRNGPLIDIISLIPKVSKFHIFGDISIAKYMIEYKEEYFGLFKLMLKNGATLNLQEFFRKAILSENIKMVQHIAPSVDIHEIHHVTENTYLNLAQWTGNTQMIEYIESLSCNESKKIDTEKAKEKLWFSSDSENSDDTEMN